MEDSKDNTPSDIKMEIAFPKSNQDYRLQLISINGSIFALCFAPLESQGLINLSCEDWSLILLAPIKSKTNILISAINVICLNEVTSEEGIIDVHATNRLVKFGTMFKPPEKVNEMGEKAKYQLDNDPAALLYFHRLFTNVVTSIHNQNPDSFSEAQEKFMIGLITLASKIDPKSQDLNLLKIFDIWSIPYLR